MRMQWMPGGWGRGVAVVGLLLVATVALAACGAEGGGGGARDGAKTGAVAESIAGNLPLDFSIDVYQGGQVLGGSEVRFSEVVAQGRPVVLNMWAGLCPPCRAEMPHFQAVYDALKDEIVVFGLDVGAFTGLGSRADAQALVDELMITFPLGSTDEMQVLSEYRVIGMPATYFILPDGMVHEGWLGPLDEGALREKVEALLAASQAEAG